MNGYPERPEPEREGDWVDPDDAAADAWKGGEPPEQGDEWKYPGWPEDDAGPEYRFWKRQRRREEDTDPES